MESSNKITKAELDDFRRDLERRILAGEYQPDCEPGQWWDLWPTVGR